MRDGATIREEKENVLIHAGDLAVTVLPRLGGKISSIRFQDQELLQTPLRPLRPRTRTMSFDDGDASGWDECLPSVAACTVATPAGPKEIPDHGDLWRLEWEEQGTENREQGTEAIALTAQCFSLPLRLDRSLTVRGAGRKWHLDLDYTVHNLSGNPVPWSWSAHPLFAVEAGDEIQLPETIKTVRVEGSVRDRLGKSGAKVHWPIQPADGAPLQLNAVQPGTSEIGDKLFAGPLVANENWCVLLRSKAGVRIRMSFDTAATSYLGIWLCYGGWPEKPGPKQMCVALEPTTAPVDSLAATGPWSRVLSPQGSFSWPLRVEFEAI